MFNSSYQHVSFREQIIALNQSYPCPRCTCGVLEPYGLTETFKCNSCTRSFVPLRGGRRLYPANRMGWKIADTFWWDGLRWRWAGTTASAAQLTAIVMMFLAPILALQGVFYFDLWKSRPDWCNHPVLLTLIVGLLTMQAIYFMCWDFNFVSKRSKQTVNK